MSFHNKKRLIWFKNAKWHNKFNALKGISELPLGFLHEYLHVLFAKLFGNFLKVENKDIIKVTGNNISIYHATTTISVISNSILSNIACIIVFGSPVLIPFLLYLLFGNIGVILSIASYNSWSLSQTDKTAIFSSFSRIKNIIIN